MTAAARPCSSAASARRKGIRSAASSSKTADQRLDRATAALFRALISEARLREDGRDFLANARSLDRGELVAHAAARLAAALPNATAAETRQAIWRDVHRLFRWRDVADLQPEGTS
jgi:hypothetical protein